MAALSAKSTNKLTINLENIIEKPLLELELQYSEFDNIYMIYQYTDNELVQIMKNAYIGAWLLNEKYEFGIPMNSIIIKTMDGLAHHKYFIYTLDKEFEVFEICDTSMCVYEHISNKIWIKNTYLTMKDFLEKLHNIYNLDINKQVILEE